MHLDRNILFTLLLVCVSVSAGVPKQHVHGHQHSKERVEDGHSSRDSGHYEGGEHHSEFDHEAILGSVKEAEEFDHLSPVESKRRLSLLVQKMDMNNDRFIDRHELKAWILRSFRMLSEEEAADRLDEIDSNKDGRVSWVEYLQDTYGFESMEEAMTNEETTEEEKRLVKDDKKMFDMADVDANGDLNKVEFTMFLSPEEFPEMLPIILEQTLRDKDMDKDGKISFQEFIGEYVLKSILCILVWLMTFQFGSLGARSTTIRSGWWWKRKSSIQTLTRTRTEF